MMRSNGSYSLDLNDERGSAVGPLSTPSIKHYLFTLLALFFLVGWLPYFDHNRFLPPDAATVELHCELGSLELLAFKSVEARLALPHLTHEGAWGAPLTIALPSALLRRHIRCRHVASGDGDALEYVYNRLLPNVSGLVDLGALLLEERARYEQAWAAWDYAGGAMRGFREYTLDEHGLADQPIDRDDDWLTVYLMIKAALFFFTAPLAALTLFVVKHAPPLYYQWRRR